MSPAIHPIPKRLAKTPDGAALLRLLTKAGYRVELSVRRDDGREMTAHDRSSIDALLAGYDADASES